MINSPESLEDGEHEPTSEFSIPGSNEERTPGLEYRNYFNEAVTEFFSLAYLDNPKTNETAFKVKRLQPSKITTSASLYPRYSDSGLEQCITEDPSDELNVSSSSRSASPKTNLELNLETNRDKNFEDLPGTLWTSEEKEIFFNCLARYSIHRSDEFLSHLPSKSSADIHAYYTLLKQELRDHYNNSFIEDETGHGHVGVRGFPGSIRFTDIPMAYEIDDELVNYEENQSSSLGYIEDDNVSNCALQNTDFINEQIGRSSFDSPVLINNDTALQLFEIYQASRKYAIPDKRDSCKLSHETLIFLEELIKMRTKEIIGHIVSRKAIIFNTDIENPEFVEGAHVGISNADIWKATIDLRLFETAMGDRTKYRDGKYPFLENYWQKLPQSLDLNVIKSSRALYLSRTTLNTFQKYDYDVGVRDHFLHRSPDYDNDANGLEEAIDQGARGISQTLIDDSITANTSNGEGKVSLNGEDKKVSLNHETKENSLYGPVAEHHLNGDHNMILDSDTLNSVSLSSIKDNLELRETSICNSPGGNFDPGNDFQIKKTEFDTTAQQSQTLWLKKCTKSYKRTLEDCASEDRLLQLEEMNLDFLDSNRDSNYVRVLKKRFKLKPLAADSSEYLEKMIMENFNDLWNKTFAFY